MEFRILKWILVCSVICTILVPGRVEAEEIPWKPTVEEVKAKIEGLKYSTAAKTTGELKALTFLVSFPEYTDYTYVDPVIAKEIIFGKDNLNKSYLRGISYPYESLTDYYNRSSYGKLNISGDVYGWYQAEFSMDTYTHWSLVEEILSFYDEQIDYRDYDGDNDGVIDALILSFALSPEDTAGARSFVFQTDEYSGPEYQFDGMITKRVAVMMNGSHLNIDISQTYTQVLIHEFGHILGSFDTYDKYDGYFSKSGGSYGNEMMNNAEWDISSFQKLVFGWIDNINIVGPNESYRISQSDFDTVGEVTVIFPYNDNLDEFILVEYLTFQANMQRTPSVLYEPGLRLWRANLSESNFNNNRDGSLKVIESILTGGLVYSNTREYEFVANVVTPGEEITPYTNPSTFLYAYDSQNRIIGKPSNVSITNIEYFNDSEIAFDVSVDSSLVPVELSFEPINLSGNYIDLIGNTEFFLLDETTKPYITNGFDVYYYQYRLDALTNQEADRSKHQLTLVEDDNYSLLNENDTYFLVIPSGMFKTFSGSINGEIVVPIEMTYFPLVDFEYDNPNQNTYYHVDYYTQNDDVIHVAIKDNIDDTKDIILKTIGLNGEISQVKLGLSIPKSSLVSSTQLDNKEIIIHYYDSDTKEIHVIKTSLQHQITHTYSFYSERYGNFVYSFDNIVLVKTLFQEEMDAGTNLFWKIDFEIL
jgi:M6 family metalloprotease-like protein